MKTASADSLRPATAGRLPDRTWRRWARHIPTAARWCALVAFLNAAVWAFVTPVFHVPDETSHMAFLQYFAETGKVPNIPNGHGISDEEALVMDQLHFNQTIGNTRELAPFSNVQQAGLDAAERARANPASGGGIIETSSQPPLYYGLGAVIYKLSPWKGLEERVVLIRLLSALCAALTTLFVFMFLRESLAEPWTWTVGALAVAFQPMVGFMAGGVHPDNLFFTASAALLFGLARAFRRGLTPALGAGIGAALAVGYLSKLNFVAMLPGAIVALGLLVWRVRGLRGPALRGAAIALTTLAVAVAGYGALNKVVWDRSVLGGGVENATNVAVDSGNPGRPIGLKEQLGYTWQLYLPRAPFMLDDFTYFPLYHVWFVGTIGKFGWLDTMWPNWVYIAALGVFGGLAFLAMLALWRRRRALIDRWPELTSYAVLALGVMGSIGFLGIRFKQDTGYDFAQARYMFPFLAFYGAFMALAALGAGRRFARPVGAAIVLLAMAHGLLGQLLVISRFYA
jgi:4-amino-4-deoxy-L-arabinose transferase-like glycosyltransferase